MAEMASASAAASPGGQQRDVGCLDHLGDTPNAGREQREPRRRRLEDDVGEALGPGWDDEAPAEAECVPGRHGARKRDGLGKAKRARELPEAGRIRTVADDDRTDGTARRHQGERLDEHVHALEQPQLADEQHVGCVRHRLRRLELVRQQAVRDDPGWDACEPDQGLELACGIGALEDEAVGRRQQASLEAVVEAALEGARRKMQRAAVRGVEAGHGETIGLQPPRRDAGEGAALGAVAMKNLCIAHDRRIARLAPGRKISQTDRTPHRCLVQAERKERLQCGQPGLGQPVGRVAVAHHADSQTKPMLGGHEIPHMAEQPANRRAQDVNDAHSAPS